MTSPPTTALPDTVHHLLAQGEPWVSMGESALTEFIVEFAPAAVTRGHIARYVRTTTDLAQAGDRMTPRDPATHAPPGPGHRACRGDSGLRAMRPRTDHRARP